MTLQKEFANTIAQGEAPETFALNIIFREITEDQESGVYWVAECIEIPGCISQGDTKAEAEKNIEDAMRLCLSVMFEDCMKAVAANHSMPNLMGISSQRRLSVDPTPHLQYASN